MNGRLALLIKRAADLSHISGVQNNYTIRTYNYWKHRLKDEQSNQIVPLSVPHFRNHRKTLSLTPQFNHTA